MPIVLGQAGPALDLMDLFIKLAGGLALFLFGLETLSSALKLVAGTGMKTVLAKLTKNRFAGLVTGTLVTGVVQSSSVTTVLLVGFISAGLMTLKQSIGVILGADIGSTITAQVIAFKITGFALVMIAAGFAASWIPRFVRLRQIGRVVMALGLVFFGMNLMGEAVAPLRDHEGVVDLLKSLDNPWWGIAIGAVFTAVVQSSAATMGIIIMLAGQGLISLNAGIAIALGANIGTCATAMLASIGAPREAVRAAVVHVLFKVLGVLLWVGLIDQLAKMAITISPSTEGLDDFERIAADAPRQIANAHTIFNVANAFVFIWFTDTFAWIVCKIIPGRPVREHLPKPRHLDEALLDTPVLAMERVRVEFTRLGTRLDNMLQQMPEAVLEGGELDLDAIARMDDDIDALHGFIISYLGQISQRELSPQRSREVLNLMAAANHLEHIGDTIETNLVSIGRSRLAHQLTVSEETKTVITGIQEAVRGTVHNAIQAVVMNDQQAAKEVTRAKKDIDQLIQAGYEHQAQRLVVQEADRVRLYAIESDVIENLKRIYYFAKRVAKTVNGKNKK